jgi:glutamyl/glutaminyl-tRNA synthetase
LKLFYNYFQLKNLIFVLTLLSKSFTDNNNEIICIKQLISKFNNNNNNNNNVSLNDDKILNEKTIIDHSNIIEWLNNCQNYKNPFKSNQFSIDLNYQQQQQQQSNQNSLKRKLTSQSTQIEVNFHKQQLLKQINSNDKNDDDDDDNEFLKKEEFLLFQKTFLDLTSSFHENVIFSISFHRLHTF